MINEKTKKALRVVGNIALDSGSSKFFTNVAVATMPAGTGFIAKIITIGAASIIGSMVGERAFDYIEEEIKQTKEFVKEAMEIDISSEDFEEEKK